MCSLHVQVTEKVDYAHARHFNAEFQQYLRLYIGRHTAKLQIDNNAAQPANHAVMRQPTAGSS